MRDVTDVYDGIHHTPDYQNNGIMFLSVENISTLTSDKFISRDFFEQNYKIFPEKGDILLTRIGNVGTPNVVESTDKLAYYVSLALLKAPKINSYFLCNLICTQEFKKELHKKTLTTAIPQKINKDEIRKITFFDSTSSDERNKIGSLLKKITCTITLHEEKEHQLEQLKSALLQKMFADKSGYPAVRFEGFDEVWKHQKFSDIVKGLQNNTLSRSELNYECGTVKNIHYGDILTKFGEFIDASKTSLPYISDNTKADKFEKSFLKDGDIVIADTAEDDTVGKCVEIQGSEHLKISAGLHTIACRPKQQYGSKYLGYYFNSPVYHNQLHPLMQGIKVTSISKSSIQNTDVYIPQSVAEQSKIGDVLSKIDSLISLNQREVKKLSIIKQSLLQKMFI